MLQVSAFGDKLAQWPIFQAVLVSEFRELELLQVLLQFDDTSADVVNH